MDGGPEGEADVTGYDSCPESFILSSCDMDSKADLNIHLEALSKKSPVKSPFKRIKLKKRIRSNETEDNKRLVHDELAVKEVMKNLLDRIEKEESQPKNLVFSTLGLSSGDDSFFSCESPGPVEEEDDNISAYLESSPEPSPSPSPPHDHEEENLSDNITVDDSILQDVAGTMKETNHSKDIVRSFSSSEFYGPKQQQHNKMRYCHVGVERLKLSENDWEVVNFYLNRKKVDKVANFDRKRHFRDRKKMTDKISQRRMIVHSTKLRKSKRCFNCESCNQPDCRKCLFCKDMKKYGGKGVKKQSCMNRPKCLYILNNKAKFVHRKSVQKLKFKEINEVRSNNVQKVKKDKPSINNTCKKSQIGERIQAKRRKLLNKQESVGRPRLQKYETVNRDDVLIRKNKIDEIKLKFKQQEEKALSGQVSMKDLSREELLFGFYL